MFKKILLFSLVGILSYLCFLIATFPVSVVWGQLADKLPLRQLQIDVKGVSGTVWEGEALIYSRGIEGVIGWDISILELFSGQLPVSLSLKTSAGSVVTLAKFGVNGGELSNTQGSIRLKALNGLFKGQRITLDGDVNIEQLTIGYYDNAITVANGRFGWSGGDIAYPAGRELHQRRLPSFTGTIIQNNDTVTLAIRDSQSPIDVIEATLDSAGMGTLKVKRRLLDVANEPWPRNSTENDVVFKVRRKVL